MYTTVESMRLENHDYLMRLGPNVMVDARQHLEVLARFINDHRHPLLYNVQFVKQPEHRRALVVSTRRIHAGEELFVDYGKRYWTGAGYKPSKLQERMQGHVDVDLEQAAGDGRGGLPVAQARAV